MLDRAVRNLSHVARRRRIPRPPLTVWGYLVRHKLTSVWLGVMAAEALWLTLDYCNYVAALAMFHRFDGVAVLGLTAATTYLAIVAVLFAWRVRVARLRRAEAEARAPRAKPHLRPLVLSRRAERLAMRLLRLRKAVRLRLPDVFVAEERRLVRKAMRELPPAQALTVISASGVDLRQLRGDDLPKWFKRPAS